MAYSEDYPRLYNTYHDLDNFECIMEAVDKHLRDVFSLDVLNHVIDQQPPCAYVRWFQMFMSECANLYTPDEVVAKFYESLHQPNTHALLCSNYILVPDGPAGPSPQVGFLEKLAKGSLTLGEPLSLMDMVRGVNGANRMRRDANIPIQVVHLDHLTRMERIQRQKLFNENVALLVNFNPKFPGERCETPKWGVLDLRDQTAPKIYCEAVLIEESEKATTEALLGKFLAPTDYLGAETEDLPSTGYTAFAWLDIHITNAWSFNTSADFSALLKNFLLVHLGGDLYKERTKGSIDYKLPASERATCTEAFQSLCNHFGDSDVSDKWNLFAQDLSFLADIAVTGDLLGATFQSGDLASALESVNTKLKERVAIQRIRDQRYESSRTLPAFFDQTLLESGYLQENSKQKIPSRCLKKLICLN